MELGGEVSGWRFQGAMPIMSRIWVAMLDSLRLLGNYSNLYIYIYLVIYIYIYIYIYMGFRN